jgi:putative ABC transport system ATP-binding protein
VAFKLHIPDLSVKGGQFLAIVGPSGCGKSTVLDLLALVLSPDLDADAHFTLKENNRPALTEYNIAQLWRVQNGHALACIRRQSIGYVLQTGGLLPFLSVEKNIELTCRLSKVRDWKARVQDIVSKLGIERQLSKKPGFLSGGERQRVSIARALVHRPAVVLADEPTAAVDKARAKSIVMDFKQLAQEEDTGIVMVTHDRDLIDNVADTHMTFDLQPYQENGIEWTQSTLVQQDD